MAETLGDFLSRKLNETADGEPVETPAGAPNSEAAAEIYGSRASLREDGAREIDTIFSDLHPVKLENLNDYAEELTDQNNINDPKDPFLGGLTSDPRIRDGLKNKFESTEDTHMGFREDTLKRVRGTLLPGEKPVPDLVDGADGWVVNSGINPGDTTSTAFNNPLTTTTVTVPDEDDQPVERDVFDALSANNRFSPSNTTPYIQEGAHTKGLYSFQNRLRQSIVGGDSGYNPNARTITVDDMRKIADDLLLSQVGHPVGRDVDITEIGKPTFGELATDLAFNASNVQLAAARVKGRTLQPGTSEAAIQLGLRTRNNDDFITGDGAYKADLKRHSDPGSFGVLSSPAEPFSAPLAMGMIWPTVYLLLFLLIVSIIIEALFTLIPSWKNFAQSSEPLVAFDPHIMKKGVYGRPQDFIPRLLYEITGLSRLDHFFLTDMSKGIQIFFGLPTTLEEIGEDPEVLFESAINLIQSSGFYLVILRAAIRDTNQIEEAFSDFASSAGFMAGLNQIFEILRAITSSVTWRFFVRLVEIGDIWYKSRSDTPRSTEKRLNDGIKVLTGENRQESSRFFPKSGRPISTLSLHSFPAAMLAGQHLGQFSGGDTMAIKDAAYDGDDEASDRFKRLKEKDKKVSYFYRIGEIDQLKRLPSSLVARYEAMMEAEYMPFYFHDIRTNEIIGLPAFITSFGDSFNVNYNSSQGMGRTDPVRIYQNTERQIDFSFKLVAMNELDHEYMYTVINKLITMIYPQRSKGRVRQSKFAGTRFIQPFSQNITASPMVRIRLGEMLHSNYSVDAFARMLGYPGDLDTFADISKSQVTHQRDAALRRVVPMRIKTAIELYNKDIKKKMLEMKIGEPQEVRALVKAGTMVTMYEADKPAANNNFGGNRLAALAGLDGGGEERQRNITFKLPEDVWGTAVITKYAAIDATAEAREAGDSEEARMAFTRTPEQMPLVQFYSAKFNIEHPAQRLNKFGVHVSKFVQTCTKNKRRAEVFFDFDDAVIRLKPSHTTLKEILTGKTPSGLGLSADGLDLLSANSAEDKSGTTVQTLVTDLSFIRESPVYKAFASTKGAGMAGFITSFGIDYGEATWNVTPGSRAPMTAEISIGFAPIHDMTPGLDFSGRQMAPSYPVGGTAYADVRKSDPDVVGLLRDAKIQEKTNDQQEGSPAPKSDTSKAPAGGE